jgi:hypothetical protein
VKALDPQILTNESFVRLWQVLLALLVLFALTTSTNIAPAYGASWPLRYEGAKFSRAGDAASAQSGGAYLENVRLTANPDEPESAPSANTFDLTWNTIDGGGIMFATGGAYSLGGTIGQPDAGTMSGGSYTLNGGFWVDIFGNKLYLPLILR